MCNEEGNFGTKLIDTRNFSMIIGGIVQMNVFLEDEGKKYRGTFFRETKQMKEGSF